ncbi:hypothetical protein AC579_1695 [Pseudocercospora musae]|uniref:Uncharacterized protein n=1 Tax=Pseudocercospora musae TaxID=113226 RepID=A0A139I4N6_9PEZI|nr:hypothetical protein AC579_1695 [Pseudocercospora musae]
MAETTNTSLIFHQEPSPSPNDPGILNLATIITITATYYLFTDLLFLTILRSLGTWQNVPHQPQQIILRIIQLFLAYLSTIGFMATGDINSFVETMWLGIRGAMIAESLVIVVVGVIELTRWATDVFLGLWGNPVMVGI